MEGRLPQNIGPIKALNCVLNQGDIAYGRWGSETQFQEFSNSVINDPTIATLPRVDPPNDGIHKRPGDNNNELIKEASEIMLLEAASNAWSGAILPRNNRVFGENGEVTIDDISPEVGGRPNPAVLRRNQSLYAYIRSRTQVMGRSPTPYVFEAPRLVNAYQQSFTRLEGPPIPGIRNDPPATRIGPIGARNHRPPLWPGERMNPNDPLVRGFPSGGISPPIPPNGWLGITISSDRTRGEGGRAYSLLREWTVLRISPVAQPFWDMTIRGNRPLSSPTEWNRNTIRAFRSPQQLPRNASFWISSQDSINSWFRRAGRHWSQGNPEPPPYLDISRAPRGNMHSLTDGTNADEMANFRLVIVETVEIDYASTTDYTNTFMGGGYNPAPLPPGRTGEVFLCPLRFLLGFSNDIELTKRERTAAFNRVASFFPPPGAAGGGGGGGGDDPGGGGGGDAGGGDSGEGSAPPPRFPEGEPEARPGGGRSGGRLLDWGCCGSRAARSPRRRDINVPQNTEAGVDTREACLESGGTDPLACDVMQCPAEGTDFCNFYDSESMGERIHNQVVSACPGIYRNSENGGDLDGTCDNSCKELMKNWWVGGQSCRCRAKTGIALMNDHQDNTSEATKKWGDYERVSEICGVQNEDDPDCSPGCCLDFSAGLTNCTEISDKATCNADATCGWAEPCGNINERTAYNLGVPCTRITDKAGCITQYDRCEWNGTSCIVKSSVDCKTLQTDQDCEDANRCHIDGDTGRCAYTYSRPPQADGAKMNDDMIYGYIPAPEGKCSKMDDDYFANGDDTANCNMAVGKDEHGKFHYCKMDGTCQRGDDVGGDMELTYAYPIEDKHWPCDSRDIAYMLNDGTKVVPGVNQCKDIIIPIGATETDPAWDRCYGSFNRNTGVQCSPVKDDDYEGGAHAQWWCQEKEGVEDPEDGWIYNNYACLYEQTSTCSGCSNDEFPCCLKQGTHYDSVINDDEDKYKYNTCQESAWWRLGMSCSDRYVPVGDNSGRYYRCQDRRSSSIGCDTDTSKMYLRQSYKDKYDGNQCVGKYSKEGC